MRLTKQEIQAIEQAARQSLPAQTELWLFGSRLDENRLGGDLDLMLIFKHPATELEKAEWRAKFTALLYMSLGEQKIDILMVDANVPDIRPVVQSALQTGQHMVTV